MLTMPSGDRVLILDAVVAVLAWIVVGVFAADSRPAHRAPPLPPWATQWLGGRDARKRRCVPLLSKPLERAGGAIERVGSIGAGGLFLCERVDRISIGAGWAGLRPGDRGLRSGDPLPHGARGERPGPRPPAQRAHPSGSPARAQPSVAEVIGPGDQPFRGAFGAVLSRTGNAARYVIVFETNPLGAGAISALRRIERRIPGLLVMAGLFAPEVETSFGGDTALIAETVKKTRSDLVRIVPTAAAIVFVILTIFLRALVAPVYLVAASLLALAAALGLTRCASPRAC